MAGIRRDYVCPFCNKDISENIGSDIAWSETKATTITRGQTIKVKQYFHISCFKENTIGAMKKNTGGTQE